MQEIGKEFGYEMDGLFIGIARHLARAAICRAVEYERERLFDQFGGEHLGQY